MRIVNQRFFGLGALIARAARTAAWAAVLTVLFSTAVESPAQDPAHLAPDKYKVLLDNPYVRVLEIHLKAGEKTPMHSHPSYLVYNFTPCKVRFTSPDGHSAEVEFRGGEVAWRDAESHAVENIGVAECHVLNVELKKSAAHPERAAELARWSLPAPAGHTMTLPADLKWQDGPKTLPPGSQVAIIEGDLSSAGPFTLRAKLPAGYKIPPHWHPADEHVTILSGALSMGLGDTFDTSKGHELTAGGFAVMPARSHHFAWTTQETILQLHGIGPWGIVYVNPADDPQKK